MSSEFDHYRAEEIIDDAWETASEKVQIELALKALEIDPDAIDAYVILGLAMRTNIERMAMLREGVRRGKAKWSDAIKHPSQFSFWQDMKTRPFMRACHYLALMCWDNCERSDAVDLAKLLLRLNPNDNQGVRYLLMAWLPVIGEWQLLEKILKRCKGEYRTEYLFSVCLNAYRLKQTANEFITRAMEVNPFVPKFLCDPKLRPKSFDDGIEAFGVKFGSEDEAFNYAHTSREAWSSVRDARKRLKQDAEVFGLSN